MAAIMRHGLLFKTGQRNVFTAYYATKSVKRKGLNIRKVGPKIDSSAESLSAKGFLRPQKEYKPPSDVENRLSSIFQNIIGKTDKETRVDDLNERYQLFMACSEQLDHTIPNSVLHSIETLGDVVNFYLTPIDVTTPLDKMKNMELPKNLHVQFDYHRFHPDTDTKFGGISAYPESSTLVTGLKYKNKYEGYEVKKYPAYKK